MLPFFNPWRKLRKQKAASSKQGFRLTRAHTHLGLGLIPPRCNSCPGTTKFLATESCKVSCKCCNLRILQSLLQMLQNVAKVAKVFLQSPNVAKVFLQMLQSPKVAKVAKYPVAISHNFCVRISECLQSFCAKFFLQRLQRFFLQR